MVPDKHGYFTKPDDDGEVSVQLASRKEWRPFRPRPEDFEWSDIGLSAARIPRFNGHLPPEYACKPWDNYVLAQHLCLCTDLARQLFPQMPVDVLLAVHLHDAEEPLGGLGDPVGPVKHSPFFRDAFKAYFRPILETIAKKAGIDPQLLQGSLQVKQFDKLAYRVENAYLRGIRSESIPNVPDRHHHKGSSVVLKVWGTLEAYDHWMSTLHELLEVKAASKVG